MKKKKPIIKTYRGKHESAQKAFLKDKAKMSDKGYFPVSSNWEEGKWGCGAFLVALLLCVVIIGILAFIYLLVVKPSGKLVVSYEFVSEEERAKSAEKTCPRCAETVKQQAAICRFCNYEFGSAIAETSSAS